MTPPPSSGFEWSMAVVTRTSNAARRSGIDDLVEQAELRRSAPGCIAVDHVTLVKYASQSALELWQLVLLHSRVDPDHLDYTGFKRLMRVFGPCGLGTAMRQLLSVKAGKPSPEETLCLNAELARKALATGALKTWLDLDPRPGLQSSVEVPAFHAWSSKVGLPVAGPWPRRTDMVGRPGKVSLRFPHTTWLLQQMAELARSACVGSSSHVGWPTNEQLSDLAFGRGVSRHLADAMASLLRPDCLPRGRRTRRAPA